MFTKSVLLFAALIVAPTAVSSYPYGYENLEARDECFNHGWDSAWNTCNDKTAGVCGMPDCAPCDGAPYLGDQCAAGDELAERQWGWDEYMRQHPC
ncbi:hypothetical protein BKA62DRAFT_785116 [Auriculariales sp. MPI-PUGE-AT-0066]|nr:hypothetical protein BKA62DRAFT_785116 [Auriculariales sp. MPI-PUGE-AT-0066]